MQAQNFALKLVLRADASPKVRAATSVQLGEVARAAGSALVNRAIQAALDAPLRHSVVIHLIGDRTLVLHSRERLVEKVALSTVAQARRA